MEKKKEIIIASVLFVFFTVLFFNKTFLRGHIPFPGDLLVSEYKPWQSYSYLGYTPGSYPSKAQYFDSIRQIYPWKRLVTSLFQKTSIPLWNPHNFSGSPLLANSQSSVFYPLWLPALVLPLPFVWTVLVILQPLLSSFFLYLYGRKVGLTPKAALFSGVIFGFSLFQTVFLEYNTIGHSILWLPLALWGFELWREKRTWKSAALIVFPLLLSGLAGHLQIFFLVFAFFHVYATMRIFTDAGSMRQKLGTLSHLLFLTLLALGMGSMQHVPTLELIGQAARINQPFRQLVDRLLIQPKQLLMLFVPDIFGNPAARNYTLGDSYPGKALYVGLLPLFFVHIAMRDTKRSFITTFYTFFSAILLLFLVHTPVTEFIYSFHIPLLSTSSPTNGLFLFGFSFAMLAGFGLDHWIMRKHKLPRYTVLLFIGIVICIWTAKFATSVSLSQKNMMFSTAVAAVSIVLFLIASKFKRLSLFILTAVFVVTLADLGYFFTKFNPFVPAEFVYPPAPVTTWLAENAGFNRYWGYGAATVEANFATQLGIYSPDGYDPLYPKRYGEFIASSRNGTLLDEFDTTTRSDAIIASGFGEKDFMENSFRKKVLNVLGTRFILDRTENGLTEASLPPETYTRVYSQDGWNILENHDALPRAFLADSYALFHSRNEFVSEFFSENFSPDETLLLESDPGIMPVRTLNKSATITMYTPNRVVILATSDTPQLLFLSDTYYPGWKAYVDETESTILRADYTFRAVALPSGSHTVVFAYEPESFSLGIKLSMISVGLVLAYCAFMIRKKR